MHVMLIFAGWHFFMLIKWIKLFGNNLVTSVIFLRIDFSKFSTWVKLFIIRKKKNSLYISMNKVMFQSCFLVDQLKKFSNKNYYNEIITLSTFLCKQQLKG